MGMARRFSLCADDANDAYQRALEIFLRRADSLNPDTAAAWLRTVIKHEALAVRRSRLVLVGPDEHDPDRHAASSSPAPDEQALAAERRGHAAEALRRLKPHEARALWLKAQGMTYAEIAEACGWSYTKVNRCITEGRRAFLARYAGIDAGTECERWAPVLSAMADGEASAEQLARARPHLRNCPACRATVRRFHAVPRHIRVLTPAHLAAGAGGVLGALRHAWSTARDALAGAAARAPIGAESTGAGAAGTLAAGGAKTAALCASVSLAAGGAYCLDRAGALPADTPSPRFAAASPADRGLARTATRDRRTDHDARTATVAALAPGRRAAGSPPRRKPERREPGDPAPPPAGPAAAPQPGDPGFETGTGSAEPPSASPSTTPPPPDPAPAEFDGGFEAD
jgi:RNA polymerase sigma factor (sigma-70 family)